jgi:hypothetical protein
VDEGDLKVAEEEDWDQAAEHESDDPTETSASEDVGEWTFH